MTKENLRSEGSVGFVAFFLMTIRFGTWATESQGVVKLCDASCGADRVVWILADWSRSPAASAARGPPDLLLDLRTESGADSGPGAEDSAEDIEGAGFEHGE